MIQKLDKLIEPALIIFRFFERAQFSMNFKFTSFPEVNFLQLVLHKGIIERKFFDA